MNNIQISVAVGLIRHHLAGFRGYPNSEAGEQTFGRAIQESCVSVSHARYVLERFGDGFPTVNEIRETANSSRAQFEPKQSPHELWEKEYGKPEPFDLTVEGRQGACLCCGIPWDQILERAKYNRLHNIEGRGCECNKRI